LVSQEMNAPSGKQIKASADGQAASASTPPVVSSGQLLGEQGELLIRHDDQTYQLRRTRADKLILTKVRASTP